ncbi:MAG: ATP-dependent protease ATPase subunit HslU [Proteobacteria bacterium]|nr:ATP-dependent protease ATPase subunit HslU [Pseudomonadota bacterium]
MFKDLTPKEIVKELDRFIIGQTSAKKAVAVALRNRWRRMQLDQSLQEEVVPKNILMIGPTGVGKTEIARRLAKLANAPFIKVEATKFTEVGYVGRDVEQIIRDLLDLAIQTRKETYRLEVKQKAEKNAEDVVLDAIVGKHASSETRFKFKEMLHKGELSDKEIDIEVSDNPSMSLPTMDVPGMPGAQMGMFNLGDILGKGFGAQKTKTLKLTVEEAYKVLIKEESEKLMDQEKIIKDAIFTVEQRGIVFIDEIDKICARQEHRGGDISREGVQRDLLPLIEGTTVSTKHGSVKTDHILFITSGAFHLAKPSDLLPELQGRLPIRVELQSLTRDDFVRILTEPEANLIFQAIALLKTEGVILTFKEDAIQEIANLAAKANELVENIGARRLHTILEKLLEDLSFNAPDKKGEEIVIDSKMVDDIVGTIANSQDLSKFIL